MKRNLHCRPLSFHCEFFAVGALLLAAMFPGTASPVRLEWNAVDEPGIAGYRLYYQQVYSDEPTVVDVGRSTSLGLGTLSPSTTYVFWVTAYNSLGIESLPSKLISYNTAPANLQSEMTSTGINLSVRARVGETLALYDSADLQTWRLLSLHNNTTGTVRISHDFDFGTGPRRFFRLGTEGLTLSAWLDFRGLSDPLADSDGDGLSNLFTFASGADLKERAYEAMPSVGIVEINTGGVRTKYCTFRYTLREGMSGIIPIVEHSADLKKWYNAFWSLGEETSDLNGDGTRTITVRASRSLSPDDSQRLFYRLRFIDASSLEPAEPVSG